MNGSDEDGEAKVSIRRRSTHPQAINEEYSELMENMERYEDFHTIDWLREMSLNRLRYRQVYNIANNNFWGVVRKMHDACSGWIVVLLIGLAAGTKS